MTKRPAKHHLYRLALLHAIDEREGVAEGGATDSSACTRAAQEAEWFRWLLKVDYGCDLTPATSEGQDMLAVAMGAGLPSLPEGSK